MSRFYRNSHVIKCTKERRKQRKIKHSWFDLHVFSTNPIDCRLRDRSPSNGVGDDSMAYVVGVVHRPATDLNRSLATFFLPFYWLKFFFVTEVEKTNCEKKKEKLEAIERGREPVRVTGQTLFDGRMEAITSNSGRVNCATRIRP